eukprot:gnl/TRDRNA2_/TRDRNA2_189188_c0_seq1.p1 gnl/TRDRNA2_/TRDRNA2_189188_c0~~gnl/TRDRNA2_/TRDRNA2_189188_c0_seq1.p1  ORF type:complete len:249 (+),score=19.46 gnl/TRDRNA2_/TRDRNA2_189188_c0_seq1:46-747(+)
METPRRPASVASCRSAQSQEAAGVPTEMGKVFRPPLSARNADARLAANMEREARARRAANFMDHLQGVSPAVGFAGFMPCSRTMHSQTWKRHWGHARDMQQYPEIDSMGSEAWTTPRSVRAAGRVLLRGKGPGIDFQDLHTREECVLSLDAMLSARERGSRLMKDPLLKRTEKGHKNEPRRTPRGHGSRPSSRQEAAGTPSLSHTFDVIRTEEGFNFRSLAIRTDERPSAVRR